MKKNLKKVLVIVLSLLALFSLSFSAFAADVSKDEAISIALKDSGYKASQAEYVKAEFDRDDGVEKWDVSFLVEKDGDYIDYDYEINAANGRILEKDWEYENDYRSGGKLSLEDRIEHLFAQLIAWIVSLFNR